MSEERAQSGARVRNRADWAGADSGNRVTIATHLAVVQTLWWREVIRFVRQRSRLFGTFAQPVVFWLLLGGGFHVSFQPPGTPGGASYVTYFYPGIIALLLLFTAVFATIAVVEDRQAGFLQGVLVAPVSRTTLVLGQSLGCTTLALGQGVVFLAFAPAVGIQFTLASIAAIIGVQFLLAFGLTNLGLIIAWRMDSTQGFHAIMNLILIPIWLLSGAVFPAKGASMWLGWIMRLNPLTYGMAALRRCLYWNDLAPVAALPPLTPSIGVMLVFCAVTLWGASRMARRSGI